MPIKKVELKSNFKASDRKETIRGHSALRYQFSLVVLDDGLLKEFFTARFYMNKTGSRAYCCVWLRTDPDHCASGSSNNPDLYGSSFCVAMQNLGIDFYVPSTAKSLSFVRGQIQEIADYFNFETYTIIEAYE